MNRAETQFALQGFFDRVACATVADVGLADTYVEMLQSYLSKLEEAFEAVDAWSIEEYERVCEYVHNNFEWIANPSVASEALADANSLLSTHKKLLNENDLLPEYLLERPNPSFQRTPASVAEFVRWADQ